MLAQALTSSEALPMAMPVPAKRSMSLSLPPSPNAMISEGSALIIWQSFFMPRTLLCPRGTMSVKRGLQRSDWQCGKSGMMEGSADVGKNEIIWKTSEEARGRRLVSSGRWKLSWRNICSVVGV